MMKRPLLGFALTLLAAVLTGCSAGEVRPSTAERDSEPDDWVVVVYDVRGKDPTLWDLVDTELAADKALQEADAGVIDGNEVGQGVYKLYFVGADREEMWRIVEPILAEAPVEWKRVQLRHGLEDKNPTVIAR